MSIAPRTDAPWRRSGWPRDSPATSTANGWKPARFMPQRRRTISISSSRGW